MLEFSNVLQVKAENIPLIFVWFFVSFFFFPAATSIPQMPLSFCTGYFFTLMNYIAHRENHLMKANIISWSIT